MGVGCGEGAFFTEVWAAVSSGGIPSVMDGLHKRAEASKDIAAQRKDKAQKMAQESIEKSPGKPDKEALVENACQELMAYGVWDGRTRTRQWVKKYLLRRQTAPEDLIFWPGGLLAAGLWQCRQKSAGGVLGQGSPRAAKYGGSIEKNARETGYGEELSEIWVKKIDGALEAYYGRWLRKGGPVAYLDDLLAGETLLSLYEGCCAKGAGNDAAKAQKAATYREAAEKLADYALAYPVDEMGSFPYRAAQKNGFIFVDGIGLSCPFLYRYGVLFDKPEAAETAVKQIVNFLAYGMDGATGLPYHGYAIKDGCKYGYKYGIIGWGRAVGWLLRGMNGCMVTEYGERRLKDSYIKLLDVALKYQHKDGYFSWQMQALDGPVDTSATGMVCVALKQGIEQGILTEPRYEDALWAGRNAVIRSTANGKVYDCSGECEGFGQYPQRYGAYPWALGQALMLL